MRAQAVGRASARNARICDALVDYYNTLDKIQVLQGVLAAQKEIILRLARNGKYGRYTVGTVEKKEISVRAYTRHSYRYIRRGKGE